MTSSGQRSGRVVHRKARVRWDRLARVALLCVLAALLYLYASAGLSLLSTWRESNRTAAQVNALKRQHRQLEAEHLTLSSAGTVEDEARQLGMMFPGERPYIVRDLPAN